MKKGSMEETNKSIKIAIFGITFKENCPDLRNTKVPEDD